jgi:hypothetical protein
VVINLEFDNESDSASNDDDSSDGDFIISLFNEFEVGAFVPSSLTL